jgi:uncharacterized integral membrane protein
MADLMTDQPSGEPVVAPGQPADPADPVGPGATGAESDPVRDENRSLDPKSRTRISGTWVGILIAAVLLVLLLVFILQNTQSVKVSYLTANGHIPLGVALTLACAGGVLLSGVVASLRILQIRRAISSKASVPAGPAGPAAAGGDEVATEQEPSSGARPEVPPAPRP